MKSILVFSNGEKIGDGLIKLPLLHEIKSRLVNTKIYWMTNEGKTVYNNRLKNIASNYIDQIFEQANLHPFFWKKISTKYDLENMKFDYVLDTQKAVLRTIAVKRIKSNIFISASAGGIFSSIKIPKEYKKSNYYLDNLFILLDLIQPTNIKNDFNILLPNQLINQLSTLFKEKDSYIGYGVGAGEKNRIWNIDNFIKVAKHFESKNFKSAFFLGPDDDWLEEIVKNNFPTALYPEDKIKNFSGPEIVMASTKFLSCALSNDSGVGHMLSTNYCPLIKIFGPKDSLKFTPKSSFISTISSNQYGGKNINYIPVDEVIKLIEKKIL